MEWAVTDLDRPLSMPELNGRYGGRTRTFSMEVGSRTTYTSNYSVGLTCQKVGQLANPHRASSERHPSWRNGRSRQIECYSSPGWSWVKDFDSARLDIGLRAKMRSQAALRCFTMKG